MNNNINVNLSGVFRNTGLSNSSKKEGTSISEDNNKKKSTSVFGAPLIQKVKGRSKKKMSPDAIARKIAQGKKVSKEEIEFLKETNLELFRKAMRANRIRENLETALKSARSETAKAAAIAEATAQASFLAAADEKCQDGEATTVGAGLYSDAIQAALNKHGSKELNKEMEKFMKKTLLAKQNQSFKERDEMGLEGSTTKQGERLSTAPTT